MAEVHKTPCACGGRIEWVWHGGLTDLWDHVFPQYWKCANCGRAYEEPHEGQALVLIDRVPSPWPPGHTCSRVGCYAKPDRSTVIGGS